MTILLVLFTWKLVPAFLALGLCGMERWGEARRRARFEAQRREALRFADPDDALLEAMREVDGLTPEVSPMAPPRATPQQLQQAALAANANQANVAAQQQAQGATQPYYLAQLNSAAWRTGDMLSAQQQQAQAQGQATISRVAQLEAEWRIRYAHAAQQQIAPLGLASDGCPVELHHLGHCNRRSSSDGRAN
jgi:hypothetical protein